MLKYGTGRGFMKVSSRAGSRGGAGGPGPRFPTKGPPLVAAGGEPQVKMNKNRQFC